MMFSSSDDGTIYDSENITNIITNNGLIRLKVYEFASIVLYLFRILRAHKRISISPIIRVRTLNDVEEPIRFERLSGLMSGFEIVIETPQIIPMTIPSTSCRINIKSE
jgi:hypothetical protein